MDNLEHYNQVFKEAFNVEDSELAELTYQSVRLWDSVGHMALIATLEEVFDIMFETDDIIDFSGYEKGQEVLTNNYGVQF